MKQFEHTKRLIKNWFDLLFSELCKIMVNKFAFVCFRGPIAQTSLLDVTHSQVDDETEFGMISLILIFFINFSFDKMIFGILQVSRDRERWLAAFVRHFTLRGIL